MGDLTYTPASDTMLLDEERNRFVHFIHYTVFEKLEPAEIKRYEQMESVDITEDLKWISGQVSRLEAYLKKIGKIQDPSWKRAGIKDDPFKFRGIVCMDIDTKKVETFDPEKYDILPFGSRIPMPKYFSEIITGIIRSRK